MGRRVGYARIAVTIVALTGAAVAGGSAPGCRTATQVTVELRTSGDLTCEKLRGVAIVVARGPVEAEEGMRRESFSAEIPRGVCGADPKLLGTLVVTPGEGAGAIIVRARISDDPTATCVPPSYRGCIVSRRAFTFIEQAAVTLPITLESRCLDVPCDVETSCRSGTCAPSRAECSESSGTCISPAEPGAGAGGGDGGPGGDGSPGDANDGAPIDGAPTDGADAAIDAQPDGPKGTNYGNACPQTSGPKDCNADGLVCCYFTFFGCQTQNQCQSSSSPIFPCLGRKGCVNDGFCCAPLYAGPGNPFPPGSYCPPGITTCRGPYGETLCTGNDDCPVGELCMGIYIGQTASGGPVKKCQPP